MNIECPNCNEKYSIDYDSLSRSSGDNDNGYGWNFKCHKCLESWWISALDATEQMEKCLQREVASTTKKNNINNNNINKLAKIKKQIARDRSKKTRRKLVDFLIFFCAVCGLVLCGYCNRSYINNFIMNKKKIYASKINDLFDVYDVFFDVLIGDDNNKIMSVCGTILNKHNNAVDVGCIEIVVKDNGEVIQEWSYIPEYGVIASGNVLNFNSKHEIIVSSEDNIKVEINVIYNNIKGKQK